MFTRTHIVVIACMAAVAFAFASVTAGASFLKVESNIASFDAMMSMVAEVQSILNERAHSIADRVDAAVPAPEASPSLIVYPNATACSGTPSTIDLSVFKGAYNKCIPSSTNSIALLDCSSTFGTVTTLTFGIWTGTQCSNADGPYTIFFAADTPTNNVGCFVNLVYNGTAVFPIASTLTCPPVSLMSNL